MYVDGKGSKDPAPQLTPYTPYTGFLIPMDVSWVGSFDLLTPSGILTPINASQPIKVQVGKDTGHSVLTSYLDPAVSS